MILHFQCIALQSDRYQPASHVHFSKWIERSLNYQSDQTSLTIVVSVSLDHEGLYFNLRTIFEARGKVRFMFVHKVFGLAAKSPSSIITFFFFAEFHKRPENTGDCEVWLRGVRGKVRRAAALERGRRRLHQGQDGHLGQGQDHQHQGEDDHQAQGDGFCQGDVKGSHVTGNQVCFALLCDRLCDWQL